MSSAELLDEIADGVVDERETEVRIGTIPHGTTTPAEMTAMVAVETCQRMSEQLTEISERSLTTIDNVQSLAESLSAGFESFAAGLVDRLTELARSIDPREQRLELASGAITVPVPQVNIPPANIVVRAVAAEQAAPEVHMTAGPVNVHMDELKEELRLLRESIDRLTAPRTSEVTLSRNGDEVRATMVTKTTPESDLSSRDM